MKTSAFAAVVLGAGEAVNLGRENGPFCFGLILAGELSEGALFDQWFRPAGAMAAPQCRDCLDLGNAAVPRRSVALHQPGCPSRLSFPSPPCWWNCFARQFFDSISASVRNT